MPGLDGYELTEDNAVQFLTHDQYVLFDSEEVSSAALEEVIRTVFDRLTSTKLASPDRLGAVFSPLVRNGHFRLQSLHDDDGDMLEHFGLPRSFPNPTGGRAGGAQPQRRPFEDRFVPHQADPGRDRLGSAHGNGRQRRFSQVAQQRP
ncbi:MAG: hypothetical protein M5U19_07080 [Microthrixaceae bacterium]|nr:hypothetical protein [Microthrixaceae bacterium]